MNSGDQGSRIRRGEPQKSDMKRVEKGEMDIPLPLAMKWYKWVKNGYSHCARHQEHHYHPEILKLIADIDEFKGAGK